jgi:antitoxin component YwqK of YwqJK toxin-antitoxin module
MVNAEHLMEWYTDAHRICRMKKPNTLFLMTLVIGIVIIYLSVAQILGMVPFPYSIHTVKSDLGIPLKDFYMNNGRVIGVAREYFADGRLQAEYGPDGNTRQQVTRARRGDRIYEVTRDQTPAGKRVIRTYHSSGELEVEQVYKDGKFLNSKNKPFNGIYQSFYPNGQIREETSYKDGKTLGPWRGYYPDGQLKFEYNVTEESPYDSGKTYYPNGTLQSMTEKVDGRSVVRRYDRDGRLLSGM